MNKRIFNIHLWFWTSVCWRYCFTSGKNYVLWNF